MKFSNCLIKSKRWNKPTHQTNKAGSDHYYSVSTFLPNSQCFDGILKTNESELPLLKTGCGLEFDSGFQPIRAPLCLSNPPGKCIVSSLIISSKENFIEIIFINIFFKNSIKIFQIMGSGKEKQSSKISLI